MHPFPRINRRPQHKHNEVSIGLCAELDMGMHIDKAPADRLQGNTRSQSDAIVLRVTQTPPTIRQLNATAPRLL